MNSEHDYSSHCAVCGDCCKLEASLGVSVLATGESPPNPSHVLRCPLTLPPSSPSGTPRDGVGEHCGVVCVPGGVFPLLANLPRCRGDGGSGHTALWLPRLLRHLHPGPLGGHVARPPQDSVSSSMPLSGHVFEALLPVLQLKKFPPLRVHKRIAVVMKQRVMSLVVFALCRIQKVFFLTDIDRERLAEIRRRRRRRRKGSTYDHFDEGSFSVSYSAQYVPSRELLTPLLMSSQTFFRDVKKYGDGLEAEEETSPLVFGGTVRKHNRKFLAPPIGLPLTLEGCGEG